MRHIEGIRGMHADPTTRLQREREVRGWTKTELTYRSRVSVPEISRIEGRLKIPSQPERLRLATALGVSEGTLFADWPQRIPLRDLPSAETAE